jgi:hypothetical protein
MLMKSIHVSCLISDVDSLETAVQSRGCETLYRWYLHFENLHNQSKEFVKENC